MHSYEESVYGHSGFRRIGRATSLTRSCDGSHRARDATRRRVALGSGRQALWADRHTTDRPHARTHKNINTSISPLFPSSHHMSKLSALAL